MADRDYLRGNLYDVEARLLAATARDQRSFDPDPLVVARRECRHRYIPTDDAVEVDEVAVGDLTSTARGSAARKNAGKPQWWQLPIWVIHEYVEKHLRQDEAFSVDYVLGYLGAWQCGDDEALFRAFDGLLNLMGTAQVDNPLGYGLAEVTRVLEFGAKKYPACPEDGRFGDDGRPAPAAAGNWAKGMPWSVCFSCAISHVLKYLGGRMQDEESGCHHLAHAACNVLFLLAYRDLYPEGDDRIPQFKIPVALG